MEQEQERVDILKGDSKDNCRSNGRRGVSFFNYFVTEITHGYQLKEDKQLYSEKQRRVTTFMKTPREVEKLMLFGFFICLDAFLFVFTFLPLRLLLALLSLFYRFVTCSKQKLESAQFVDILRVSIFCSCLFAMTYIDTSALYHIIRAQSVIKLYVIYNMLEIFDRLLASIGQDTLDTLFWLAAENSPKDHFKTVFYFFIAFFYVFIHTNVILFQVTTLSVAINSHSKALLTIMMSNNFVELKGSVFKKFETNNLFQMSCSDIRERFHYVVFMFVVVIRNFSQSVDLALIESMIPIVLSVILSEVLVDGVKHAFITKFNDISPDVYRKYRLILSNDITVSRSLQATSEHSDLVSRRIGFIPLPLGCILCKTISESFSFSRTHWMKILATGYVFLLLFKTVLGVILLRTAWRYHDSMEQHKKHEQETSKGPSTVDPLQLRKRRNISPNILEVSDTKEHDKSQKTRKSRSLSDIERFTLCSSRII